MKAPPEVKRGLQNAKKAQSRHHLTKVIAQTFDRFAPVHTYNPIVVQLENMNHLSRWPHLTMHIHVP